MLFQACPASALSNQLPSHDTHHPTCARPPLQRIVETTQGYPYFLQEWGKHAWNAADASPIDLDDVERASATAIVALDESFFRVRFDRLTGAERRYLRAMAELGPEPHRSGGSPRF